MGTIKEDYVSFETAKLLKEKGFDEQTLFHYGENKQLFGGTGLLSSYNSMLLNNYYSTPTLQMAMKWLREVYNIIIEPESVWNGKKWEYQLFIVTPQNAASPYYEHNPYKSYEECVEAAIKYCLKNMI